MNKELKKIKKLYGDKMMHFCRDTFSTILEKEGTLLELLLANFYPNKELYNDLVEEHLENDFKNYIYYLHSQQNDNNDIKSNLSARELLDKVGYVLYECHCEADIQKFKHYYQPNEQLCTFCGRRLERCHVFFAVKKDIDDIKRENFKNPRREDDYGVSIISIQFTRGGINTVSIKNRYNHTVINPDATFSNNLDNIVPGLTNAFEKEYKLNIANNRGSINFETKNYVQAEDGRYYKYNYERNNIYYCLDNIIIDNFHVVKDFNNNKERYLLIDYFIVDLQEKKVFLYDEFILDSFVNDFENINKISVATNNESSEKEIIFTKFDGSLIKVTVNKLNKIIKYINESVIKIGSNFLLFNSSIKEISLPKVQKIHSNFLYNAVLIKDINFPEIVEIDNNFLINNRVLSSIDLPKVKIIGDNFLMYNKNLVEVNMPNLLEIGNIFLWSNENIKTIWLPNIKKIGNHFLDKANLLTNVFLPSVEEIGDSFLLRCIDLSSIQLPSVVSVGKDFLHFNRSITEIVFPNLKIIGSYFLYCNELINSLSLPNVEEIDSYFMSSNKELKSLELPMVTSVGKKFMADNRLIAKIDMPNIKYIASHFLESNELLKSIIFPNVNSISKSFLSNNNSLEKIIFPESVYIDDDYFKSKYFYKITYLEKTPIRKLEI